MPPQRPHRALFAQQSANLVGSCLLTVSYRYLAERHIPQRSVKPRHLLHRLPEPPPLRYALAQQAFQRERKMPRFQGQVAVITGGTSGIGAATARRLRQEGASIAVWDRLPAADADHSETFDLTDAAAVQAAADATVKALGRIDILVCSAGITGPNTPTWTYPVADWLRVMDVNVNAVFYCNRAVVPAATAASSTSPRSPARKATPTPPPIPPRRPRSSASPNRSARNSPAAKSASTASPPPPSAPRSSTR